MKKLVCIFLTAVLLFGAVPEAVAVCYPLCQRYDIWSRCYITAQNWRCGSICADSSGDGICDGCEDRLYYVDLDQDGLCDNYEDKACADQSTCVKEQPVRTHHGRSSHHGGGKHHCR